jgi:hypothetical protein
MRRVQRVALDAATQKYLTKRQADADAKLQLGSLNPTDHWKASRQTISMEPVLAALRAMMGKQQRCMYCVDSHGCDIEHFRPKGDFQAWIYLWNTDVFIADLIEHDDHGLLGWFFKGNGQTEAPLVQLREQHAPVWQACLKAFEFQ